MRIWLGNVWINFLIAEQIIVDASSFTEVDCFVRLLLLLGVVVDIVIT